MGKNNQVDSEQDAKNIKKDNMKKIIIYGILVLIGMGICFYLGYSLGYSEAPNDYKTHNYEPKKTVYNWSEEPVSDESIINEDVDNKSNKNASVSGELSSSLKESTVINNIVDVGFDNRCDMLDKYATGKKMESKDIASLYMYHFIERKEFYGKKDSFTLDEFYAATKKYFYGEINFDPTSIDYNGHSCPAYRYDSSTKTFHKQTTACGGTCGSSAIYNVVSEEKDDDLLKIHIKVLFLDYDNHGELNYYRDYHKTELVGKTDDGVINLIEKGSPYLFTFKVVDGNYTFVSSEPM